MAMHTPSSRKEEGPEQRDVSPASASASEHLLWRGSEFCSMAHSHAQGSLKDVVVLVFVQSYIH